MRYWPVYGGGETITATLSNALVKKGHTVHIAYQYECNREPMPYSIDDNISQFKTQTSGPFKSEDVRKLHDYIVSHNIDIITAVPFRNHRCQKGSDIALRHSFLLGQFC